MRAAFGGSFEEIQGPLQEAIEYVRLNPLAGAVLDCALRSWPQAIIREPASGALLPVRTAELAVSGLL